MKKIILTILFFWFFYTLLLPVSSVSLPQEPVIVGVSSDHRMPSNSEIILVVEAYSPDGGTIRYQWYSTTANDISTIRAIDGAVEKNLQVPEYVGTYWYCCALWNVDSSGNESPPVYTRLIMVERYIAFAFIGMEIEKMPDKLVYYLGERFDPTGMRVRMDSTEGPYYYSNGSFMTYTGEPLVNLGEQQIAISYAGFIRYVTITVVEQPHTHSFGEWTVTTEATCTEPGIKARECDCGAIEREAIPAAGHQWDDGKVTKQPTANTDGEMTYTCKTCQATRTEAIPATGTTTESTESTDPTDPTDPTESTAPTDPTESTNPTDPTDPTEPSNPTESTEQPQQTGKNKSPVLWIAPIAAVCCCVGVAIFWVKKSKNKR